jgi:hypothetical protein
MVRGLGSVLNPYDITYGTASKCQAKAITDVKLMVVKLEIIEDLLKE